MEVVYLNVGGVYFATSRSTLAKYRNSFFSPLTLTNPNVSEYFIDRDPTHFRWVLNWLRGSTCLPADGPSLRELRVEADFFSLQDMVDAIDRTQATDMTACLERLHHTLKSSTAR